jgi:hypothetical protein
MVMARKQTPIPGLWLIVALVVFAVALAEWLFK